MAYGDILPDENRVTRGGSRAYDGEFTTAAFAMRPQEKELKRISVDWVECPSACESERNPEGSARRLQMNNVRGPYAVLGVADIRQVRRGMFGLDVIEFGNKKNPCHCGITGFSDTPIDLELQHDLAEIANKSPAIYDPGKPR